VNATAASEAPSEAQPSGVDGPDTRPAVRRALARLLVARLGLAAFGVGLALAVAGEGRTEGEELGLWAVLAVAFGTTAVSAAWMGRVRRPQRFGVAQLGADVGVVTALVHFSGGGASPFGFLYLPITVFGAMLFDRRGAYGSALLASLAYGAALAFGRRTPAEVEFALWCGHTGALLVVALLASALAREVRGPGERLDASRARLRALASLHERTVECLTSGLLTLDAAQRVSFVNPEAERIIGRDAAALLGEPLDAVLPGASALARDAEAASGRMRSRLQVPGPDGEARHLGLAVSILRGDEGAEAGHVVIFQDVSAVVRMERELRRRERLAGVGELAASIAHEIRNPLAAISGSVELLRGGSVEADRERLMDIVLREIGRLDALIRDFLQFARPAPPKLAPVALPALLEEVAQMLATAVPPGAQLEVEADPSARALADATQLRQVLWNLARNACDALEGPGVVRLCASRVAGEPQGLGSGDRKRSREEAAAVEIVVEDTGRGIPLADLERIFDPFYTTKPDGTGLGLPTVHRIVESHGGALQVESQPGVGTRFRVRLPAAEATA
jgi:two-component system sensor histidine kinase PilS (NtrC family)